jgi:tetratricopeptide (TPR) repeat protein
LQVSSSFTLAEALYSLGDFRRCAALLRRNVQLLKGDAQRQRFGMTGFPAAMSRGILARSLAELGKFDEAAGVSDEAIHMAEDANQPFTMALQYSNDGFLYLTRGELPRAIRSLIRAVDVSRTWNFSLHLTNATARLGYVHVLSGYVSDGLALLEDAAQMAGALGGLYERASIVAWLSEAYLRSGQPEEALDSARRAFELADRSKQQGKRAHTLRALGDAHAAGTSAEVIQAELYYGRALELASELGMRPLEAHCYLGLGRLERRFGRLDEARSHLAEALRLYTTLGMAFWVLPVEEELREATVQWPRMDSAAPPLRVEISGTR